MATTETRKWQATGSPRQGGDTRQDYHCEATGEYCRRSGVWSGGRFVVSGPGRGFDLETVTGPTGVSYEVSRPNGKVYPPAEF